MKVVRRQSSWVKETIQMKPGDRLIHIQEEKGARRAEEIFVLSQGKYVAQSQVEQTTER